MFIAAPPAILILPERRFAIGLNHSEMARLLPFLHTKPAESRRSIAKMRIAGCALQTVDKPQRGEISTLIPSTEPLHEAISPRWGLALLKLRGYKHCAPTEL